MDIYYLPEDGFGKLVAEIGESHDVYVVTKEADQPVVKPLADAPDFAWAGVRAYQPLKTYFFSILEKVADYPIDVDITPERKPFAIVGAASCDVRAIEALDRVFLEGDFKDPFYEINRAKGIVISFDCTNPLETCFCVLMGNNPYPDKGFDLNMSKIEAGYLVEVGSEKGKRLVEENKAIFKPATQHHISQRDSIRSKVKQTVEDQSKQFKPPAPWKQLLSKRFDHEAWKANVETCVECAACLFICPTCQCFLLYDQKQGDRFSRLKMWDACAYKRFARVAGGANPRPHLVERFRHRYYHKLDYFPTNFGFEGCTGCGRCIVACPGRIDMRKVLKQVCSY